MFIIFKFILSISLSDTIFFLKLSQVLDFFSFKLIILSNFILFQVSWFFKNHNVLNFYYLIYCYLFVEQESSKISN